MFHFIGNGTVSSASAYYYHKCFQIDKGGFGTVYYGLKNQKNKDELVAVKFFTKSNQQCTDASEKDIKKLMNIKHDNVVDVYDIIKKKGERANEGSTIYLILQLCNRGNLEYFARNNDLSDHEIRHLFKQMVEGLHHIHTISDFIHRDIKPNNFILYEDVVKIADFGEAKELKNGQCTSTFKGTPLFMNPQMLIPVQYTNKGDVFSLGVTLYFMYYKKTPWFATLEEELKSHNESAMLKIYERLLQQDEVIDEIFDYQPYVYIPDSAKNLIKNMLQFEEVNRYDINQVRNHSYLKFQNKEEGIKSPKYVKGLPSDLIDIKSKLSDEEKRYQKLFSMEIEKKKIREIMENIYFEREKMLFFNICIKGILNLRDVWPNKDNWINLLIILMRFVFQKNKIFYNLLKRKKIFHSYSEKEWNLFYDSEYYDKTLDSMKKCYDVNKTNWENLVSKVNSSDIDIHKLLDPDYKPNLSLFSLLQKIVLLNLKSFVQEIKQKEVIKTMYDLMIIATMNHSITNNPKKGFTNFEKYHEDKNFGPNLTLMQGRINIFLKSLEGISKN